VSPRGGGGLSEASEGFGWEEPPRSPPSSPSSLRLFSLVLFFSLDGKRRAAVEGVSGRSDSSRGAEGGGEGLAGRSGEECRGAACEESRGSRDGDVGARERRRRRRRRQGRASGDAAHEEGSDCGGLVLYEYSGPGECGGGPQGGRAVAPGEGIEAILQLLDAARSGTAQAGARG